MDTQALVLEAFAGPGGWSEGLRIAGFTGAAVGVEWDMAACRTAAAAGHLRVRADVSRFPVRHLAGRVDGVIASPPCTTFSPAGHGTGRQLTEVLANAMTRTVRGDNVVARARRDAAKVLRPVAWRNKKLLKVTRAQRSAWVRQQAVTSALVLEPVRLVRDLRPRWVALEQVPSVLPLWRHLASLLRELGYQAWAGKLDAECYGVAQTRDRAILMARCDGLPVGPPEPTHQQYRHGRAADLEPDLFGDPLPAPVSMADALGWGVDERPAWTVTAGGTGSGGGVEVFGNAAARRAIAQARNSGPGAERAPRPVDAPSYTIRAQGSGSHPFGTEWVVCMAPAGATSTMVEPRPVNEPGHTITGKATAAWVAGQETARVTVQEAAVLQSFPADYPWQGNKSQQYRQVGDAIPPRLAAAVLHSLIHTSRGGSCG